MISDPDEPRAPGGRPPDVETGFWLWVIALPLTVTGYLVDVLGSAEHHVPMPVAVVSVMFVVNLFAVVLTFQILMRHGYRWARTLLTGGVGNVIGTLFGVLINGTIVSILQFNGTLSSWWTRIGVGLLTLIFIGIQSLFYMRKKHS